MPYRYVLDCEVTETFFRLSNKQREELIRIFRSLASDPFVKGDQSFRDGSLREIQKKRFGNWTVAFWSDHPVEEVRIVGLQRVSFR